jgi:Skp family chaperone for outer membrane proteins
MTQLKRICLVCLLGAASILMLAGTVLAQQKDGASTPNPPEPRIAIVNVEVALRESLAVKSARAQMSEITAKYKKEIDEEESQLRALDQELQQQRTILAPEAFAQRRDEIQRRATQLQRKARDLRQAMDQGFKNTMQRIQAVLFEEIAKLAKEMDVNLVIPSSQIIVAIESFDITRPAIERLDTRLPDVKLTMEEKPVSSEQKKAPAR